MVKVVPIARAHAPTKAPRLVVVSSIDDQATWSGDNMPTLKAPNQVLFLVSLILATVAWLSVFADFGYLGQHPSILMTFAYILLAVGCFL